MTILHIITSSVNWGGMEQYALDLALSAVNAGHRVIFVARNDSDVVPSILRESGFKPYLLPIRSKFDFSSVKKLRKIVVDNSVDVIHTHQPKNIFHARLAVLQLGVRVVHTVHFVLGRVSPHWLYKRIFNMADVLISVSDVVGASVLKLYSNIDKGKVITIHNSIDPQRVAGVKRADNEVITIGYAGRIIANKGIFTFVDAVKILNERGVSFKAIIAGTGVDVKRLKVDISGVDNIDYVGFEHNIGNFISKIDVATLPSIVVEAFSLMAVEYMASGRALVASNCGGHIEVIDSGVNGQLFEAGSALDLADKLQQLIVDNSKRDVMGDNARLTYAEKLDFNDFIRKTIATYQ